MAKYRRIMVLSPHPDDETIGCGGAISYLYEMGGQFLFVFASSGEKGLPSHMQKETPFLRENEAGKALEILTHNRHNCRFLRLPDGELLGNQNALSKCIHKELHSFNPDAIFVPSYYEEHPDHLAVPQVLLHFPNALSAEIIMYEVWSPLRPNCLFPIDVYKERKAKALQEYASQKIFRISEMAFALNQYRGCRTLSRKARYYEAFSVVGFETFKKEMTRFTSLDAQ